MQAREAHFSALSRPILMLLDKMGVVWLACRQRAASIGEHMFCLVPQFDPDALVAETRWLAALGIVWAPKAGPLCLRWMSVRLWVSTLCRDSVRKFRSCLGAHLDGIWPVRLCRWRAACPSQHVRRHHEHRHVASEAARRADFPGAVKITSRGSNRSPNGRGKRGKRGNEDCGAKDVETGKQVNKFCACRSTARRCRAKPKTMLSWGSVRHVAQTFTLGLPCSHRGRATPPWFRTTFCMVDWLHVVKASTQGEEERVLEEPLS